MKIFQRKTMVILGVLFIPIFTFEGTSQYAATSYEVVEQVDIRSIEAQPKNSPVQNLTREKVSDLADEFMNRLVQETDDDYRVINFSNKNDLINSFSSISSKALAKEYVDYYYREVNGELFIVPTETPPWLNTDRQFEMQEGPNGYIVLQKNHDALYGTYTIQLEIAYDSGVWIIRQVKYL